MDGTKDGGVEGLMDGNEEDVGIKDGIEVGLMVGADEEVGIEDGIEEIVGGEDNVGLDETDGDVDGTPRLGSHSMSIFLDQNMHRKKHIH